MISFEPSSLKKQEPSDATNLYATIDVRWYKLESEVANIIKHKFVVIITERASNYVWSYLEDVCLLPNICKFIDSIFEQFNFVPKYFTTQDIESNDFLKDFFFSKYNIKKLNTPVDMNYRRENKQVILSKLKQKILRKQFHSRTVKVEYQAMIAQYNCSVHKYAQNIPRLTFKERKMNYPIKQRSQTQASLKNKGKKQLINEKDALQMLFVTEENLKLLGSIQVPKRRQQTQKLDFLERTLSLQTRKAIEKLRNKPLSLNVVKNQSLFGKRQAYHKKVRNEINVLLKKTRAKKS